MIAQEILTQHQNWTVLGILGTVLIAVIGLLVWIVKWLCTRFATSIDTSATTQAAALAKNTEVVGDATQTLARVGEHLERLHDSHEEMRRSIDAMPSRCADELQRRKLG